MIIQVQWKKVGEEVPVIGRMHYVYPDYENCVSIAKWWNSSWFIESSGSLSHMFSANVTHFAEIPMPEAPEEE